MEFPELKVATDLSEACSVGWSSGDDDDDDGDDDGVLKICGEMMECGECPGLPVLSCGISVLPPSAILGFSRTFL